MTQTRKTVAILTKALKESRKEVAWMAREIFENGTVRGDPATIDAGTKREHTRLTKIVARADAAIAKAKGNAS